MVKKKTTGRKRRENPLRNIREKKFVKAFLETHEIGRSAVLAGYADPTYGSKLMRNPRILTAIQEAMEKAGIHDEYLAKKLKEGLEATYPMKYSSRGRVIQEREPDYFTRAIYLDKAFRIRGDFAPEKQEVTEKRISIVITPELVKGLLDSEAISVEELKELASAEKRPQLEEKNATNTT